MSASQHNYVVDSPEAWTSLVRKFRSFPFKDRPLEFTADHYEAGRSYKQQAVLHILIRKIAQEVGINSEYFKQEYIKRNVHEIYPHWPEVQMWDPLQKAYVMIPKSEGKLTKPEESEQIDHLHALAAEWGVEL